MKALGFAAWWKHPEIRVEERMTDYGPVSVLVGVGEPERVSVFDGEPLLLPSKYHPGPLWRPSGRARHTHGLAFASIQTTEQALAFAQRYGLLGLNTSPVMVNSWKPPTFDYEPVEKWIGWADRVRGYLEAANKAQDVPTLASGLSALCVLELKDDLRLRFRDGKLGFEYRKLLTALLMETALEITGLDSAPVACHAQGCGTWFIPQHPQAVYCSETCRRRQQYRRAYEKKGEGQ